MRGGYSMSAAGVNFMGSRYILNCMIVCITTSLLCAKEVHQAVQFSNKNLEQLEAKIMNSWNEVNIARAISPHGAVKFHNRIVRSYSDLYTTLCEVTSQGRFLSHELLSLFRIFKGLCISHDAWCAEQNSAMTIGAYCLMKAIVHMWRFAVNDELPPKEQSVDLLN